jgi:hypothetical protein
MVELVGMDAPGSIAGGWLDRALLSVRTLGGGNHFLEAQRDDDNRVYFMLHSGSRNLGKQICNLFAKRALAVDRAAGRELPDPWTDACFRQAASTHGSLGIDFAALLDEDRQIPCLKFDSIARREPLIGQQIARSRR